MSNNVIKVEKLDTEDVTEMFQDEIADHISSDTEFKLDSLNLFTLLIQIKEQLNCIQNDVTEVKRKVNKIEENQEILFKKLEKSEKSFAHLEGNSLHAIKNFPSPVEIKKDIRTIYKPKNFPSTILFDNIPDLENFDKLLEDFSGDNAIYFCELLKEKLRNFNDFKPFMRTGFNLLMTKDLQTQCSYTGKIGYGVSHLKCFVLLQAACRARFTVEEEVVRRYCKDYFSNIKYNNKMKPQPSSQNVVSIKDLMDIEDYKI